MNKLILFLLLISTNSFAQSYMDFDKYLHSQKIELKANQDLDKVLKYKGYDLKQRNWKKITLHMNGISQNDLLSRKASLDIYLPPKISFQDYLKTHRRQLRSIASTKPFCVPINNKYIKEKFNTENLEYIKYFKLISSRKIKVKKNQTLYSIVTNDQYSYKTVERGIHLIKMANGIRSHKMKKNKEIYLPFCAMEDNKRTVASVKSLKTKIKKQKIKEQSASTYTIGINSGALELKQNTNNVEMNFTKLSLNYKYNFKNSYSLQANANLTKFSSIVANSGNAITPNDIYQEIGITLAKQYEKLNLGIGYDSLNYFLLVDNIMTANQINRISFKPFYALTTSFGVFSSLGYINDLSTMEINGYDASIGAVYRFGDEKRFNLSGFYYGSELSSKISEKNTSKAYGLSLSFDF